jgi:hypothetical protein
MIDLKLAFAYCNTVVVMKKGDGKRKPGSVDLEAG